MTLKRLTIGDIETIKKLMLDIFSGEPWNDVWTDAQLHRYVSELTGAENSLSFGLYQEGVPVGLALGRVKSWCTGTEYWVDEFGVLPERQRRRAVFQWESQVVGPSSERPGSRPGAAQSARESDGTVAPAPGPLPAALRREQNPSTVLFSRAAPPAAVPGPPLITPPSAPSPPDASSLRACSKRKTRWS